MREEGLGVGQFNFEGGFGGAGCFVGGLVEGPVEVAFAAAEDFDLVGSGWGFGVGPAWEAVVLVVAFAEEIKSGGGLGVKVVSGGEA